MTHSTPRLCSFDGCGKKHSAKGYCPAHYIQWRKGQTLRPLNTYTRKPEAENPCKIMHCSRARYCKGFCDSHYRVLRKYNIPEDEFIKMCEAASCEACGETEDLAMDHDHACCSDHRSCGKCFRGWLCRRCNTALGFANDSADRLYGLARYIEAWQSR